VARSAGRGNLGSGGGRRNLTQRLKTAKKRSNASARWLERQINDPYVAEAKAQGYRSRAAFKLLQIDERFHLLRKGMAVIDLGCAPGGWLQVAAKVLGPDGRLVGIDLLPVEPVQGATILEGDFLDEETPGLIEAALEGPADLVLSDMAANTIGHAKTDHLRTLGLAETAAYFAFDVLRPGGAFVCKVLQGGTEGSLLTELKRRFESTKHVKPAASRSDSSELYLVAQGFKGTQ